MIRTFTGNVESCTHKQTRLSINLIHAPFMCRSLSLEGVVQHCAQPTCGVAGEKAPYGDSLRLAAAVGGCC